MVQHPRLKFGIGDFDAHNFFGDVAHAPAGGIALHLDTGNRLRVLIHGNLDTRFAEIPGELGDQRVIVFDALAAQSVTFLGEGGKWLGENSLDANVLHPAAQLIH